MEVNKDGMDEGIIELTSQLKKSNDTAIVLKDDPLEDLKQTMVSYFKGRLEVLKKQDEFKEVIQEKIIDKILTDEKVTVSQLTSLLQVVIAEGNLGNESILSLFKPGQGQSGFFQMKQSSDSAPNGLEDLNSEQLQKIDKLNRLLDYASIKKDES